MSTGTAHWQTQTPWPLCESRWPNYSPEVLRHWYRDFDHVLGHGANLSQPNQPFAFEFFKHSKLTQTLHSSCTSDRHAQVLSRSTCTPRILAAALDRGCTFSWTRDDDPLRCQFLFLLSMFQEPAHVSLCM